MSSITIDDRGRQLDVGIGTVLFYIFGAINVRELEVIGYSKYKLVSCMNRITHNSKSCLVSKIAVQTKYEFILLSHIFHFVLCYNTTANELALAMSRPSPTRRRAKHGV